MASRPWWRRLVGIGRRPTLGFGEIGRAENLAGTAWRPSESGFPLVELTPHTEFLTVPF